MLQSVIALVLFGAVFVALGLWQVQGQVRYLRLYARKSGESISVEQQAATYLRNPFRGWLSSNAATWRGTQVTAQQQEDAELEGLRQAYLTRRRIWLSASALALVALGVYLNVLNQ
jgi:hypothetical protein